MSGEAPTLRELFGDIFSKTAFKKVDGQMRIIDKYGELEMVGSKIDIYVFGRRRRFDAVDKIFAGEATLIRLTGEAYTQVAPTKLNVDLIASTWKILGIRRKRRIGDEQKKILSERLKKIKEGAYVSNRKQ